MRSFLTFILIAGLLAISSACAWDGDTLAFELKGLPDVADAVAGRFERQPDLYYEMRRDRVLAIKDSDLKPEDLDDLGVAYDKLGESKSAISAMNKKVELLKKTDRSSAEWKEAQYRLLANRGTFYIHDGLAQKPIDRKQVELGLADLKKAVELNPDAHFGREFVQIVIVEQLLQPNRDKLEEYLGPNNDTAKFREGVLGIMAIGNGWESVDMFYFLRASLGSGDGVTGRLIDAKISDLISQGKSSAFQEDFFKYFKPHTMLRDEEIATAQQVYKVLKKNGEEFRSHYNSYVMAKLEKGQHPDNRADFFDDYEPLKMPDISLVEGKQKSRVFKNYFWIFAIPLLAIGSFVLIRIIRAKAR